jgi:hypothetical protein
MQTLDEHQRIEFRNKINKLFKDLRNIGIVCRKNYACCGNCGHHAIQTNYPGRDYVFYHAQESDHLKEGADACYFAHSISILNTPKVIRILKKYGSDWNGDDVKTIVIPFE